MDKWLDTISDSGDSKEMLLTTVKEDARKSRSMAYWSFSGAIIPLLALIFGLRSLHLSKDVPNKGKVGKFKQISRNIATGGLLVSLIMAVVWTVLFVDNNKQHNAQLVANHYKAEVSNLDSLNTQYQAVYQSYVNLPSSTTKTKDDWDSYYAGLISELSVVNAGISQTSYADPTLAAYSSAIASASSDFSSLLTLSQSSSDMQFQIQSDQSTVASDKGLVAEDQQLGASYAVGPEGDLATAEQQLSSDQKTLREQNNQAKTLGNKVSSDNTTLINAKVAADN